MMERKQSAARAAALALAERAARMAQRERRIGQELAGFLGARERQLAILEVAHDRCEAIMARARRRAETSQSRAEAHVVELVALIGDRQEVAEHTGLSLREIRRAMREAQEETDTEDTRAEDTGADEPGTVAADAVETGSDQAHQETEQEEAAADQALAEGDEDEGGQVPARAEEECGADLDGVEVPQVDGAGQGDGGAEEDSGQVPELSEEESGADLDGSGPAAVEPEQQEWVGTWTQARPEVASVPGVAAAGDGAADWREAPAGEVPMSSLGMLGTWTGTPVGEIDVSSPDLGAGVAADLSVGLLPDVVASGEDGEPVAGWQDSTAESWWSSPPDSAG